MPVTKEKARSLAAHGLSQNALNETNSTSRSTATKDQRERILSALKSGPKTSYDLRRMGCYQAPARVIELRRMGHVIRTERVTLWDRDGYPHKGCALYRLEVTA